MELLRYGTTAPNQEFVVGKGQGQCLVLETPPPQTLGLWWEVGKGQPRRSRGSLLSGRQPCCCPVDSEQVEVWMSLWEV